MKGLHRHYRVGESRIGSSIRCFGVQNAYVRTGESGVSEISSGLLMIAVSFDAKAKELFEAWLSKIGNVEVGKELGKLPLQADVLLTINDRVILNEALESGSLPSWMSYLSVYNLIEFKSEKDKLAKQDLAKLAAYACLFMASLDSSSTLRSEDLSLLLVVSKLPKWASFLRQEQVADGVFECILPLGLPCLLVVIQELSAQSESNPLFFFGSREQRLQIIRALFSAPRSLERDVFYRFSMIYYTKDMLMMAKIEEAEVELEGVIGELIRMHGIGDSIAEVGLGVVIAEVGLDAVIAEVGLDAVITKIDPQEYIDAVDESTIRSLSELIEKRKRRTS